MLERQYRAECLIAFVRHEELLIHLIGPGGAGKSTAGPLIAARLGGTFRDLDACFSEQHGNIDEYISAHGYEAYARANVDVYTTLPREETTDVVAVSSGFMTYAPAVHPLYSAIRQRIAESATTVALLPCLDLERCVIETVRRQRARGLPGRQASREEAVIRERFPIYAAWPKVVETMRAPEQVADQILARLA